MVWERVNKGKNRTLARKRRVRARAWSRKSELYARGRRASWRRGKASRENFPGERRKSELVSGRRRSPGGPGESRFCFKSDQTRNVKRLEDERPFIR